MHRWSSFIVNGALQVYVCMYVCMYTSLFIRNTDSINTMMKNKVSIKSLTDIDTIIHTAVTGAGIFNVKPFNTIWPQLTKAS